MKRDKVCEYCEITFTPKSQKAIFCSTKCRVANARFVKSAAKKAAKSIAPVPNPKINVVFVPNKPQSLASFLKTPNTEE